MSKQSFVIQVSPDIARDVRRFLGGGEHGYDSLSEFVEVAIMNQLAIEPGAKILAGPSRLTTAYDPAPATHEPQGQAAAEAKHLLEDTRLLSRPGPKPSIPVLEPSGDRGGALSSFTNRLSPVKIACRVLANLAGDELWPSLGRFQEAAGHLARSLGLRLRETDDDTLRRWIGYPVGEDRTKSIARFVSSFTIVCRDGKPVGPMAVLGLASVLHDRVGLTRNGWRLAAAPSPITEGTGGLTLSPAEAKILRGIICQVPAELDTVQLLLRLVSQARGRQSELDQLLARHYSTWSREMVVAQRAALLGRLGELEVLEVTGRGMAAVIKVLPNAKEFAQAETGNHTEEDAEGL